MQRALIFTITLGLLALAAAPIADAKPDCVQVYPWSELCNGNVDTFTCYYVERFLGLEDCEDILR